MGDFTLVAMAIGDSVCGVLCPWGWSKAREGIETLIREHDLDVNLLMIAASLGAAAIGYWNEGAMLILFLHSAVHWRAIPLSVVVRIFLSSWR